MRATSNRIGRIGRIRISIMKNGWMDRLKGDQRGSGRSWYVVWGLRCHKKWRVKITRSEEPSPPPTHHGTTRGTTRRNAEAHNHVYTHTHAMRPLVEYYTLFTLHLYEGKLAKTDNLHSVMLLVLRSGLSLLKYAYVRLEAFFSRCEFVRIEITLTTTATHRCDVQITAG